MQPNEQSNAVETPKPEQPTAEHLELARLQAETAQNAARAAEAGERLEKAQQEQRDLKKAQALRDGLAASGIKFYEPSLIDSKLLGDFDIRVSDDGEVSALVDGKRTTKLERVYQRVAEKMPYLADGRTIRHLRETTQDATTPQKAKSEMTQAEKIEYLKTHSIEEWERLPTRAMRTVEIKTLEDYAALPMKSKLELIEKYGSEYIGKLPSSRRRM